MTSTSGRFLARMVTAPEAEVDHRPLCVASPGGGSIRAREGRITLSKRGHGVSVRSG
jgi:hypothetical protein